MRPIHLQLVYVIQGHWCKLADTLEAQIVFEMAEIDRLLAAYAPLLMRAQSSEPDLVEITATASVLHSFYNGVERIFLLIAKERDHQVPVGPLYHRDLLRQMAQPTANRPAVASEALTQQLLTYLAFRHFYRHSYSFVLDWGKLVPLVRELHATWAACKVALEPFSL